MGALPCDAIFRTLRRQFLLADLGLSGPTRRPSSARAFAHCAWAVAGCKVEVKELSNNRSAG